MMQNKTAIIVISHNSKEITSSLCEKIVKYTKCNYELLVVETGSKKEELTQYPTYLVPDGIRMTNGIKFGLFYYFWKELNKQMFDVTYDNYWILVNDTIHPDYDVLSPMVDFMNKTEDCGEIHPFIQNSPSLELKQKIGSVARKESFCEIVCPLFSRKIFDKRIDLFDERFIYGWGVDYEIPKILHDNNFIIYISNQVGVIHNAGTTVRNGKDEDFKTMTEQFDKSRENMIKGLTGKYGERWYKTIYDSIPNDVSKDAYVDWIVNVGCNCKMEDLI